MTGKRKETRTDRNKQYTQKHHEDTHEQEHRLIRRKPSIAGTGLRLRICPIDGLQDGCQKKDRNPVNKDGRRCHRPCGKALSHKKHCNEDR